MPDQIRDQIRVTVVAGEKMFDRFTAVELTNSLLMPSEASFEVGDTASWLSLQALVKLGTIMRVTVNQRPRLTGRIEYRDSVGDAGRAAQLRFVVRTKLTDAFVASCDPRINVKGLSIKQFVLACYRTIGVTEEQFIFDPSTARDLLTGKASRGARAPEDIEAIQQDAAKINPPETVFAAVDRHLRRHRMMHWDAPDGRIIVGKPDDTQEPIHNFVERISSDTWRNNVLSIRRVEDVGQTPTLLGVYGQTAGREFTKAKVSAIEANQTLVDAQFNRPVVIIDRQLKSRAIADARVRREMAQRSRSLDSLEVMVDGLSHPVGSGSDTAPYAPDTVFGVECERLGGKIGAFHAEATILRESAGQAHSSTIRLVPKGTWVL